MKGWGYYIEFLVRGFLIGIGGLMAMLLGIAQIIEWKFDPSMLDPWVILVLFGMAHLPKKYDE